MKKRVGILTSGGDCPGLNATIRGVAKALYARMGDNVEIVGILNGYSGLISGDYKEMSEDDFRGILTLGGTILGTKRTPFKMMRVVEDDNVEGPSRKLQVCQMRERQIRNAFLMMLLSQGVPLIYGGDEIGNSQNGNNNAYCQDNQVGWIDWKGMKKNRQLLEFVKSAIAFRKEHPILHVPDELRGVDYKTKGLPDVSLHGERAWYMNSENTSRLLGIMYYGAYAKKADGSDDASVYIAYNFHWETREFALPNLRHKRWKKVIDTSAEKENYFLKESEEKYSKKLEIAPRTIVVLLAVEEEKKDASVAAL